MGVFDDIKLEWQGTEYVVPANRVMGAIARIEDVITLAELMTAQQKGQIKFTRIAQAYGAVLRYAGAKVEDEEVYAGLFDEDGPVRAVIALVAILEMMLPRDVLKKAMESGKKDTPRKNGEPAAARTSRKRTP